MIMIDYDYAFDSVLYAFAVLKHTSLDLLDSYRCYISVQYTPVHTYVFLYVE